MKSLYINQETNDLEFDGQNNFKMVDDDDELLQCIWMIITTNLNEWFLDPDVGFDRFAVLGKGVTNEQITNAINQAILQEPRISRVENVDFEMVDKQKRKATVAFTVVKDDGSTLDGSVTI